MKSILGASSLLLMLVGTVSVETSEFVSRMLKKVGIVHSVLNAKYHQQAAEIVARAGQRGAAAGGRAASVPLACCGWRLPGDWAVCSAAQRRDSQAGWAARRLRGRQRRTAA